MENKSYVINGVGYGALFEAMVTLAEEDMKKDNKTLADDAKQGLVEWLKVLKVLDIADAVLR